MFPLQEEEPLGGVAGRPARRAAETAPGPQTREVEGQTPKARKGTTAAVCRLPGAVPAVPELCAAGAPAPPLPGSRRFYSKPFSPAVA